MKKLSSKDYYIEKELSENILSNVASKMLIRD